MKSESQANHLKLRPFESKDLNKIQELHNKYYQEFGFPEFMKMLNAFIIEDPKDDEIVMAGGIELIAEIVLVTNKDKNKVKIGRALVEAQKIAFFTCNKFGIRELFAFVNNDEYASHLIQHGFSDCYRGLSMKVPNG